MTPQQFKLVWKKVKNNLSNTEFQKSDYSTYINKLVSDFPNGRVEIICHRDKLNIVIMSLGVSGSIIGKIKFPLGWGILSLSWWRWRLLCSAAEKEYKRQEKIDAENARKWHIESIDKAIIETFPEILEEQIFGDD